MLLKADGVIMETALKAKTLFLLIIFFAAISLPGEDKQIQEGERRKVDISLNGGLSMKFSALGNNGGFLSSDTNFAYLVGFKAATVFNKSWYVGGAAYFLGNEISYNCENRTGNSSEPCKEGNTSFLSTGYGGLTGGYTFNIKSFFRIETGILMGGGRFSALNYRGEYYYREGFFVMEPEVNLLFVITKYFAASINFSYRLITGMSSDGDYDTADMSGPTVGLDIRLGSF